MPHFVPHLWHLWHTYQMCHTLWHIGVLWQDRFHDVIHSKAAHKWAAWAAFLIFYPCIAGSLFKHSFRIFYFHHVGPRTDVDARGASSIYIKTAFLNSAQNHGPYPNTGIICLCVCYIDHVFSRFYFSLCDGNTRVCTRFSLFTPYRTCIKDMQAILPQLKHGLYPV